MHGLINRAVQRFAEDTYGPAAWTAVAEEAQPGLRAFEAMLSYDDAVTHRLLDILAEKAGTPRTMLLEDMGTYLVSHANTQALRRLLRFGGESFTDFLYSLDDLPDRVRLAVPDLILPPLDLIEHAPGRFSISIGPGLEGFGFVLLGLLRAMADDYGVLALADVQKSGAEGDQISITVAEASFAEGRYFNLARQEGPL